ncbi:DUF4349 domain-containing protein [Streptomyces chilikensis]|uniref:DUF4349 domain-containing protein n=1 Tax=Streptomyces chilikensis TaxID=1194079 RepID=UPI0014078B5B|nr:DUF4349 domain-containing protein [Streptomyces chilikensis]
MARRTLAAMLLAASLALAGCGADDGGSAADQKSVSADDAKAAAPEGAAGSAADGEAAGKGGEERSGTALETTHIIRTAQLSVRVKDVDDAVAEARRVAVSAGGYVGKEESHSYDYDRTDETEVVLRVPSEKYDGVMEDLKGTGHVYFHSSEAEDVTDEVVDVDSRVKSQRAGVERLRELMDEATELTDVVALEGELASREAELESLLARQASLEDRTSLATVTLTLTDEDHLDEENREDPDPGVLDALKGGWDAFVTTLHWIVLAVGAALPFAVVLAAGLWLWLRSRRRGRAAGGAPAGGREPRGDQEAWRDRKFPSQDFPGSPESPESRGSQES